MKLLVQNPCPSVAISPAALFRILETGPTMLFDEVEGLNAKNRSESTATIVQILNGGHGKDAVVHRCEGQGANMTTREFHIYGPKVFAAIGKLPDTLADRSIVISMQRQTADNKASRLRSRTGEREAAPIRTTILKIARQKLKDVVQTYDAMMEQDFPFLSDRDCDIWTPLFALCSVLAPERIKELRKCAKELSGSKAENDQDDSDALRLLADIRSVWPKKEDGETPVGNWPSKELVARLVEMDDSSWKEDKLNARRLAAALRPFGVWPKDVKKEGKNIRHYEYERVNSAFSRYLAPESSTTRNGSDSK